MLSKAVRDVTALVQAVFIGDEANVNANKDALRDRLNNEAAPMPQAGLLPQETRDQINAYLDAIP